MKGINKTDYNEKKSNLPNENWGIISKKFFLDRATYLKGLLHKDMHYGEKLVIEKNILLNFNLSEMLK